MLFKNWLHPWCVAVWVCNNTQCAMHNATIPKTTFFELGLNIYEYTWVYLGERGGGFIYGRDFAFIKLCSNCPWLILRGGGL